jgi:predicted Zn-dependent peptidase
MTKSPAQTNVSPADTYRKTVLPNGIRVVTEELPHVRSISVGVWVEVGSRDEQPENNGITHFIEHMVFKGTKRFSVPQIARSLESVGGYLNAFTTKEHTCFYARVLDQHLERSIDVISDLLQHPLFPEKEIEKEKQVVIEEIKNTEDEPDDLIHEYFERNIFHRHSLGYPIIGNKENVARFSANDLRSYTERYYRSGNIVLAAAGSLKHDKVVELVEKYFHSIPKGHGPGRRRRGPKTSHPRKEIFEKSIKQSHICIGSIGYSAKSEQRHALYVLNTLLGEGMSSRLFQNIREKYGFAYSIYSFINLLSDTGDMGVYIGTDQKHIEKSLELIQKELDNLATKPVSAAELKRAREQVKGSMTLGLESTSSRMMRLGSGELFYGKFMPIDEILKKISDVSVEDIQDVAKTLFKPEKYSTVIFRPDKNQTQN